MVSHVTVTVTWASHRGAFAPKKKLGTHWENSWNTLLVSLKHPHKHSQTNMISKKGNLYILLQDLKTFWVWHFRVSRTCASPRGAFAPKKCGYLNTCILAYLHSCILSYLHTWIPAYLWACIFANFRMFTPAYLHN